jgi:signal transduction histidine kinase
MTPRSVAAPPPWKWLPYTFAAVALAFVSVTVVTQLSSRAIDRAATEIATNAAPSIEKLGSARSEARHLHAILREQLADVERGARPKSDDVAAMRERFDRDIADYFLNPTFEGERGQWRDLLSQKDRLEDDMVRFSQEIATEDETAARARLAGPLAVDFTQLGDTIAKLIELNALESRELALDIRRQHFASELLAVVLDVVCVVLTFAAAIVLRRSLRVSADLEDQNRRIEEARAVELEQFAGRIAHDILSPLGAVSFALEIAGRSDEPAKRTTAVERGRRGLARVQRLVDGLLGFARSGARPEPGAYASVSAVINDVVSEIRPSAEAAGIELRAETIATDVACSEGVLTSLVANLLRNAVKYIGDPSVKRITVRAMERAHCVRFEVTDTGRGLPPDLEARVFEPYVRGAGHDHMGVSIGLGLATVRKLVEAHGGVVGVRSTDAGCTFWFELPHGSPSYIGQDDGQADGSMSQIPPGASGSVRPPASRGRIPLARR